MSSSSGSRSVDSPSERSRTLPLATAAVSSSAARCSALRSVVISTSSSVLHSRASCSASRAAFAFASSR
eukprot:5588887-Prymnesium_polylepis.1